MEANEFEAQPEMPETFFRKGTPGSGILRDAMPKHGRKSCKDFGEASGSRIIAEETRKSMDLSLDPKRQDLVNFLRAKNISEDLIGKVLKNGLSDGFDKLLHALGITNEEIKRFDWPRKFDPMDRAHRSMKFRDSNEDDDFLSPDNSYLKKHFGDCLVRAMKDIVKRKPLDPVLFLGQWLLNYKVCEERENRLMEIESELAAERKLLKIPVLEQESEISDQYDEREESIFKDWNYINYEQPEMQ